MHRHIHWTELPPRMKFSQLKRTKKSENNLGLETNSTDLDLILHKFWNVNDSIWQLFET
jgi:hypothetical protein